MSRRHEGSRRPELNVHPRLDRIPSSSCHLPAREFVPDVHGIRPLLAQSMHDAATATIVANGSALQTAHGRQQMGPFLLKPPSDAQAEEARMVGTMEMVGILSFASIAMQSANRTIGCR